MSLKKPSGRIVNCQPLVFVLFYLYAFAFQYEGHTLGSRRCDTNNPTLLDPVNLHQHFRMSVKQFEGTVQSTGSTFAEEPDITIFL